MASVLKKSSVLLLIVGVQFSSAKTCPGFPGYCSESFPGQTCVVVCSTGRNNVPLCQEDGTWTDVPRCVEHEPGVEEQIPGICPGVSGYCSEGYLGQKCNFACAVGPAIDSTCTGDGTWFPYPTCQGDVRETQDGCNPCPGPDGKTRNRQLENLLGVPTAQPKPIFPTHPAQGAARKEIPTFSGGQTFGAINPQRPAAAPRAPAPPAPRAPIAPVQRQQPAPQPRFIQQQQQQFNQVQQQQRPQPQQQPRFAPQPQQQQPRFAPQPQQQQPQARLPPPPPRPQPVQPQQPQSSLLDPNFVSGVLPISQGKFTVGANGQITAQQRAPAPARRAPAPAPRAPAPRAPAPVTLSPVERRVIEQDIAEAKRLPVFDAIPRAQASGPSPTAAAPRQQQPSDGVDNFGPFELVNLGK